MSFTIRILNIATDSPEFVVLSGRQYQKDYTPLPNQNLPKALRSDLERFFTTLTSNTELPLEENTFLIKATDGAYNRIFGPVLKSGSSEVEGLEDGKLYIQWGQHFIPVEMKSGALVTTDGKEIDAEFGVYNFSGRGEDVALLLSLDEDGGQVVMPIVVRFADWDNPLEAKALNTLLKKSPELIVDVIQKASKKTGGTYTKIEPTHEVDFKSLEVKRPYEVIGYYPCKTTYGTSFRLFIQDFPSVGDIGCAWAHSSLRPLLSARPEITPEKPASLVIQYKDTNESTGKTRIRSSLFLSVQEVDDDSILNLDF
jgi:hypothetical protein